MMLRMIWMTIGHGRSARCMERGAHRGRLRRKSGPGRAPARISGHFFATGFRSALGSALATEGLPMAMPAPRQLVLGHHLLLFDVRLVPPPPPSLLGHLACRVTAWDAWQPCSVSCGGNGMRTRRRHVARRYRSRPGCSP